METVKQRLAYFLKEMRIPRAQVERKLGWANGYIAKPSYNPSEERMMQVLKAFPRLNPKWLLHGEGSMLKPYVDLSNYAPRIPIEAAAGVLSGMSDGVMPEDCEFGPIVRSVPRYDFTIKAQGDSMLPEIMSNDELACRFVRDAANLHWGRIYVLDTADGVVVKRVYDAGDSLRCVSLNPKYPDFLVPKDRIHTIAQLVGLIRAF